jgi:hypothetical protein
VKTENSDVPVNSVKRREEEFQENPVQFSILASDDVQSTILNFILFKDIDLLAMLTNKKNFFVELFQPSLSQRFSNTINNPILVMIE